MLGGILITSIAVAVITTSFTEVYQQKCHKMEAGLRAVSIMIHIAIVSYASATYLPLPQNDIANCFWPLHYYWGGLANIRYAKTPNRNMQARGPCL